MLAHSTHKLISLVVLLAVALQPLTPAAARQTSPSVTAYSAAPTPGDSAPGILFRTTVTVDSPARRAQLEKLGVTILAQNTPTPTLPLPGGGSEGGGQLVVLVDADQLEALARLRFEPRATDDADALVARHAVEYAGLAAAWGELRQRMGADAKAGSKRMADAAALVFLSTSSLSTALSAISSIDDDADGLTNTQEAWWCTDPLNADSDEGGSGTTDGVEVQALKDWLANRRSSYPATGKPFAGWPPQTSCPSQPGGKCQCQDDDGDDVPDLAERWELGLNMNNPSTDRDRYNDGMELFGFDHTAAMSPIVRSPGNHPIAAAYPVIHVDAAPSTFRVETVTELHLDTTVITGTANTYGTAETRGTSDSVANTVTWNEWQETSITTPLVRFSSLNPELAAGPTSVDEGVTAGALTLGVAVDLVKKCTIDAEIELLAGEPRTTCERVWDRKNVIGDVAMGAAKSAFVSNIYDPNQDLLQNALKVGKCAISPETCIAEFAVGFTTKFNSDLRMRNQADAVRTSDPTPASTGHSYVVSGNAVSVRPSVQIVVPAMAAPIATQTDTHGRSWGGAQTTTHTEYQEHTVSQSEQFSSQNGWTSGWARDSAHSADLTFSYRVSNAGTDYARSLSNLIFNVYLGRDPHPAFTCQMNNPPPDRNCNLVSLSNVMPGDQHEYTTGRIWLSFEQMQALDLGGPIYVVVDSYSLGDDDVFFQNARQGGMTVVMDDGMADGDESLDVYVLPVWEGDTVLDVLARYFPTREDADGNLLALSTPEWTTPPTWIERPLTDASWFNLYLDNLGDGSTPFRDTPAQANSTLLMRYQTDTDRDGYTDRSELRLGTDPNDPASHPSPGLVAGLNTTRTGNEVTGRLAFLNTGNYDAYGVEAIMYAPDRTVSIGNNTIGGSGRVKAASQVVLGSRVLSPGLGNWVNSTARPYSAGSYAGNSDKTFTFTAQATGAVGSTQPITLTWNDGGGSGSVTVPASYQSPLPITVTQGVEIGFYSGSIIAGDAFTVGVQLPRDTFTYTVQSEPFTKPGVVVSYNDPQGNHRFISPVELGDLGSDLAPYAGQMLAPLSLEIATTAAFTPTGSNTTNYVFNLPDSRPVEEGHLFVEYVKDDGTVVAEQVFTQTLQPGPNIIPVAWNSSIFTETYQADHDYNVLALVTDWQGNIIQSIARPLSSFQTDPTPAFAMSDADAAWDFGTATQGEILEHTFIFANTGFLDLYTYLAAPSDMNVTGGWSRRLSPSDTTTYTITADTRTLPVGAYDKTITIRTSDPANTARTVHLSGDVQALAGAALSRPIIYRPWDRSVWIPGSHNPNDDVDFSHGITTDPAEVEPLYVYDEGRGTLLGTGETLPAELAGGALPASVFGSGSDGELVVATGQVAYADDVRRSISGTISPGATALIVDDTSGFASGDVVLIHQTRGSEAGKWELARLSSVGAQLVLTRPTEHNYVDGGGSADNQAQVVRVPQYSTCTIDQNGVVTVHPWDGQTGGILAFLCSRTLQMSGTISANGSNGIFAPAGTDYAPGAVGGGFRGGYARRGALHSQAGQGEGYPGMASGTRNANGNGGGGAGGGNGVEGGGGGGGGHGTPGAAGYCPNCGNSIGQGSGGGTFGTEDLSTMVFGGGGGGGANDDYNGSDEGAGSGGSGGGAVIIHAREIQLSGLVTASGGDGADVGKDGGGGGGGAGGAILIKGQSMTLGAARIKAIGGAGGVPVPDDGRSRGGDGGVGRIRVEYQNITPGWSTEPQATTQTVRFFLMEKLGDVMVRYTLPESFTGGRTYWMQFGQRYVYPASGDHIFHVRLPKGRYADARLDLILAKANSSPVSLCLDMGNDGACDWTYSGSPTIPFTTTTTSLVTPLNAFLASAAPDPDGVVVVPIRVNLNTGGELFLTNLVATPTAGVDVSVSPSDLAFGATTPTEGESVSVSATLHNPSDRNTGPLTASFQATPSGGAPWHIGSTFVSNVPAGGTAQAQIVWNTLGFTGTVPVKVTVDPFNRLPETNESNNQATANLTIKTRPDLQFTNFQLSDPEPVAGETVTATLPVHNNGQATAGNEMVALYNGNPDAGGTVVGAGLAPALAGGATANVTFAWTPATPGLHRLFARADRDRQVNESDEGNNDRWQDVYVGFRSPIALDAGITAADPPYTPTLGYGVVDTGQADILANCGAEPHETYRLDPSGAVAYRFDHLLPGHFYHLDLVLYECGQGAGRQEYVKADGNALAGPEDLGDSQVHRLSLLLDPALYADRTISVTVEAREGLGALVNQIALHDVDYRYADSGSATEPAYPAAQAQAAAAAAGLSYGYLDGSRTSDWGTLPYQTARVDLLNSDVRYRFDGLDPLRRYKLRLSFYQGSGSNRVQQIYVDDQPVGAEITIVSGGRYSSTVTVPLTAYTGDGSIVASVVRTNATVGAMVNEIALEEETLSAAAVCSVTETPFWTQAYGNVIIAGQPALPGTLVTAETPRGEVVGCFVVKSTGLYGFLPIYGEDLTASPAIPGMRDGETVIFRVNGALAVATPALAWYDDKTPHQVHLAAGVTRSQAILVKPGWNLASFRVDPPAPLVDTVLHSIAGKYCRLLAESAIYDCNVPERFRTLRELHAAVGYYLRLEGSASATLLVEGVTVPVTTPLALHRGWNWTGYLPEISLPVTVALQSIAGQYLQVTDGSKTYDPALPDFSTLTQLDPGKGYLIYASAAVSLTYPAGGGTAAAAAPEGRSGVCPEAAETPFFTFLYGDIRINGQPAAAGARIEAITPRGQVAGCFTVDRAGQYGFLPVYGDDGGNPPIPGFREGEPIALRVNGAAITLPSPLAWTDDKSSHRLDLAVGDDDEKRIYLPVITR